MRFNILSAVTVALSASTTYAELIEPKAVVDAIDKITDLSSDTADAAEKVQQGDITAIVPAGFRVVKGFKDIISTVTMTISDLGRMEAPEEDFAEEDQNAICKAFTGFVMVHQDLLRVVIGKNSLLASLPVGDAIASVLRTLEGGVDEVAEKIIELVPTCAEQAKKDLGDLDDTIGKAIDTYSS
ncbi:unnamed protein product [Clonostachys rosea]|uniref:Cell wall galactomannoprotein n=1 Tax=Bionectria ochroleuca TaxID=29856 RepID=A0ABY6TW04_BIOOC|nr:unnamed protein product [Clonostachys rosea]